MKSQQLFTDAYLHEWRRLYHACHQHETALVNCLLHLSPPHNPLAEFKCPDVDIVKGKVDALKSGGPPDCNLLLEAYRLLTQVDHCAHFSARQGLTPIGEGNNTYWLVPRPPLRIRDGFPDNCFFAHPDDLGRNRVLDLRYAWIRSPENTTVHVVPRQFRGGYLPSSVSLCIGLALIGSTESLKWHCFELAGGRLVSQCLGADPAAGASLLGAVTQVLDRAQEHQVDILLFPELVISDELLKQIRECLNASQQRSIRFIIAGSRHHPADAGKGFVNRCTVLDWRGKVLWEQDKLEPYRFDVPPSLPGCPEVNGREAWEPATLSNRVVIADYELFRLVTPICLDFILQRPWNRFGAFRPDLALVPAMSKGLDRFRTASSYLANQLLLTTVVCNAGGKGGSDSSCVHLPVRTKCQPNPNATESPDLLVLSVPLSPEA